MSRFLFCVTLIFPPLTFGTCVNQGQRAFPASSVSDVLRLVSPPGMFNSTSRLLSLCCTPEQHAQLLDLERKTKLSLYLFPTRNPQFVPFAKGSVGGTGPVPLAMLTFAALLSLCFWIKSGISAGLTGECLKRLSITRHYIDMSFPCSPITLTVIRNLWRYGPVQQVPSVGLLRRGARWLTPWGWSEELRPHTDHIHGWSVVNLPSLICCFTTENQFCQQRSSTQICPDRSCLQTHWTVEMKSLHCITCLKWVTMMQFLRSHVAEKVKDYHISS